MAEHVAHAARCPGCSGDMERTITMVLKKQITVIVTCNCECGFTQCAQITLSTLINYWFTNHRRSIKTEELEVL